MQYSNPSSRTAVPLSHRFSFTASRQWLPMVARGVLTAWMMPLVLGMLTTLAMVADPAAAQTQQQIEVQGVTTQRAIVIDFSVAPGIDPVLGRKAADALAVELQRSGEFEVIPRQRVEQALAENSALTPPFNAFAQTRLAQIVGARSAFSGRVVSVQSTDRKQARVQLDVRQVDVVSNDYIGGAQVSEMSTSALQQTDPEVLRDQAVNRAAAVAVRIMKQTRFPIGTVLNTSFDNIVINLGATSGVAPGQRYAVLRDVYDRGRNVTERVRIGELTVKRVESELSDASISGGAGVRTGDKVRQIYVPSNYPVSTTADGSTALPTALAAGRKSGGGNIVKKAGSGLGGILGLVGLVALAGFAGGSSGSRADSTAPANVNATPLSQANGNPRIDVNFSTGLPGILAGENVVGYFIYRGEAPGFAATGRTLQEFVSRDQGTNFSDIANEYTGRTIEINIEETDTGTGGNNGGNNGGNDNGNGNGGAVFPEVEVIDDEVDITTGGEFSGSIQGTNSSITAEFTRRPLRPGTQYFYKVQRITIVRQDNGSGGDDDDDNGTGNGGTGTDNGTGSNVTFRLARSNISAVSGGATAIVPPVVTSTSGNLDNFRVTINAQANFLQLDDDTTTEDNVLIFAFEAVDQFVVQVSGVPGFPAGSTFEQVVENPGNNNTASLNLVLGDIGVPNFETGGNAFVRVGARNTSDSPGNTVFGRSFTITTPSGRGINSRFLPSGDNRRVGGVGLPGSSVGIRRNGGMIRRPGGIAR